MRPIIFRPVTLATALIGFAAVAATVGIPAGPAAAQAYSAHDLLSACTIADNDSRDGFVAELECEQYMMGFVHALAETGDTTICPPPRNTADEIRWAYMRWVHQDYSARKDLAAGKAVMGTLSDNFGCP